MALYDVDPTTPAIQDALDYLSANQEPNKETPGSGLDSLLKKADAYYLYPTCSLV